MKNFIGLIREYLWQILKGIAILTGIIFGLIAGSWIMLQLSGVAKLILFLTLIVFAIILVIVAGHNIVKIIDRWYDEEQQPD